MSAHPATGPLIAGGKWPLATLGGSGRSWRQRLYDGTLIGVGAHLLLLGRPSGLLRVVDASADAYRERFQTAVFPAGPVALTGPSYARGRVYVRNIDEVAALPSTVNVVSLAAPPWRQRS